MIPYVREFDFAYGRRDQVSPLIQRVIADNPGPFTFTGTGTYIVGKPEAGAAVAVNDPGPLDDAHLAALLAAVEGRTVSHVLVTHTHTAITRLWPAPSPLRPGRRFWRPNRRRVTPMPQASLTRMMTPTSRPMSS